MSEDRILLQRNGWIISDQLLSFPGGDLPMEQIQKAWIETRRPGLPTGLALTLLGAALLLRSAGFLRLIGLFAVVYGILRSRMEEHALIILQHGSKKPLMLLRTKDGVWAKEVLSVLTQARLFAEHEK